MFSLWLFANFFSQSFIQSPRANEAHAGTGGFPFAPEMARSHSIPPLFSFTLFTKAGATLTRAANIEGLTEALRRQHHRTKNIFRRKG